MPRDRVEHQFPGDVLARLGPEAEGDPPAGTEHPMRLTQCEQWSRHMMDAEVRHCRVEFTIRIGQRLGVTFVEPHRRFRAR